MLARVLVEIPPYPRPESRHDAARDERKTPGEPRDQEGDDRRRRARAEASDGVGDADRLAAGNVAPSPMPSTKRTAKSEASPFTAPVTMVVIDQTSPQTVRVRRAPK